MQLSIEVCSHRYRRRLFEWAQETVAERHYLYSKVPHISQPFAYVVQWNELNVGCCIVSGVHQTVQRGFWGEGELITKWQVGNLARIWLHPAIQRNGWLCKSDVVPGFVDRHGEFRSTTATWLIETVIGRIQRDRIALWPPVQLTLPYHIRMVVSYSDPKHHSGLIYRLAGAEPMWTNEQGEAIAGKSGKFGWIWRLTEPDFTYVDVPILRNRQVRLF